MSIKEHDIKKIAQLSRIELREGDLEKAKRELLGIFNWIDHLQSIDVSQAGEVLEVNAVQMNERQDIVKTDANFASVLKNAPSAQHGMFSVPKMVE